MKYFCTLSDSKYLLQGLAMYNSLLVNHNSNEFKLFYLCLDDNCYDQLKKLNFKNVELLKETELVEENEDLKQTKLKMRPELGGGNNNQYCWALASYLCSYVLRKFNTNHILYIDSDIYFYDSTNDVYDEIGNKSIGIIKHRHNNVGSIDGAYNVGIIYFKNSKEGNACLNWWKEGVLFDKYPEYATCGDQKYLEGFIPNFGEENVCIIDNIGHGAPWNFRLYGYDNYPKKILYGGKEQVLVFNHFSRIRINDINQPWPQNIIDFTGGNYQDHTLGFQVFNIPQVKKMYIDYVNVLKSIKGELMTKYGYKL